MAHGLQSLKLFIVLVLLPQNLFCTEVFGNLHKYCNDMLYHRFWHGEQNIVSPGVCIVTHSFFKVVL